MPALLLSLVRAGGRLLLLTKRSDSDSWWRICAGGCRRQIQLYTALQRYLCRSHSMHWERDVTTAAASSQPNTRTRHKFLRNTRLMFCRTTLDNTPAVVFTWIPTCVYLLCNEVQSKTPWSVPLTRWIDDRCDSCSDWLVRYRIVAIVGITNVKHHNVSLQTIVTR